MSRVKNAIVAGSLAAALVTSSVAFADNDTSDSEILKWLVGKGGSEQKRTLMVTPDRSFIQLSDSLPVKHEATQAGKNNTNPHGKPVKRKGIK